MMSKNILSTRELLGLDDGSLFIEVDNGNIDDNPIVFKKVGFTQEMDDIMVEAMFMRPMTTEIPDGACVFGYISEKNTDKEWQVLTEHERCKLVNWILNIE